MRNCYDGLISAAAATTNSVYGTWLSLNIELLGITLLCPLVCNDSLLVYAEFSEALEEMGSCFLAKTALNGNDDESGKHIP
jgi:hypothetical protein